MANLKWPIKGLEHIALEPGTLVVLAAPRRTGKTTFAVELARKWSREHRVVLSTTESNPRRLVAKHPDLLNPNLLIADIPNPTVRSLSSAVRRITADVLIVDELGFLRLAGDSAGSCDSLKTLAERCGCVVVAACGRSPMVDAIIDADAALKVNSMPAIRKEARHG